MRTLESLETDDTRSPPWRHRLGHDRPLCFLHIPKTGGTSLTDAVARLYPPDRVFTDRGNLSEDYVAGLGDRLGGRAFLAGHAGPGVAARLRGCADIITLLREPADHAVSNYLHVLSEPHNALHADAMAAPLGDYLRRHHLQIDFQTRALCVALAGDPLSTMEPDEGERALRFVTAMAFVGVVERMDECAEVLSRLLGSARPIVMPCMNTAVSRGVSVKTLERLRREYDALRDDAFLAPMVARDARLHQTATAILDRLKHDLAPGRRRRAPPDGFMAAGRFSTRSARFVGDEIVADLDGDSARLINGPYVRLPPGHYAVAFHFTVKEPAPRRAGRVKIDALSNGRSCLRRRWLSPRTWASERARTLAFVNTHPDDVLEFRVRCRGFAAGRLIFEGVTVGASSPARTWPSYIDRSGSWARRCLVAAWARVREV